MPHANKTMDTDRQSLRASAGRCVAELETIHAVDRAVWSFPRSTASARWACYSIDVMRTVLLGLALLGSACGGATRTGDAALAGPSDALPDTGAAGLLAAVDADPCLYSASCEAVTHPGMCTSVGPWTGSFELGLDGGACETRPSGPCSLDGSTVFPLMDLLGSCPFPGEESSVVVTFSEGCATHLYAYGVADFTSACYVRVLEASHFDCIDQIPCLDMAYSTLMPVAP